MDGGPAFGDGLDPDERALLASIRALHPDDRAALQRIIDSMSGAVMPATQVPARSHGTGEAGAMASTAFDALIVTLGNRRVTPNVPPGRVARVVETVAPEPEPQRDASSAWTAFIRYVDANGDESERRFTCRKITGFEGATHIFGFCHEREAVRTFRVDRIVELVCAETGVVLEAGPHFEMLRQTGALNVEDRVMTDVARVLTFLARCDGRYHPLERDALQSHLERYCLRFNGTDAMLARALGNIDRLAPDAGDVVGALYRLSRSAGGARVARYVLDCGADVVDADGRHADEEMFWAVEISAALKTLATQGRTG